MTALVEVQRHAGWAVIHLRRPEKRNAMNRLMRAQLGAAIESLEGEARVVVLTGAADVFCAGADLKERTAEIAAGQPDTAGEEAIDLNLAIRRHSAVFVAAVNGLALGAGFTLVNSCDLALAVPTATFGCPELGFGAYASMAGPTAQLTLSRKQAAWMLFTTERIDAATALQWGLVNEVVPHGSLLGRVDELAGQIAAYDPIAIAHIKQALNHVPEVVRDWEGVMRYGQQVNLSIKENRDASGRAVRACADTPNRPRGR